MNQALVLFAIKVFTGFFAVMNPIANTPLFIGLVEGKSNERKIRIAKKASITAFIVVSVFVLVGKYIFELFGITIPAFKITGGILLFFVGFEMLMSKKSSIKNIDDNDISDSVSISPLAIPILAGPGTIVNAMDNVTNADYVHIAITIFIFAFMILLTYICFRYSELIVTRLGENIITVIGKLMGLILAIIGTGMLVVGIKLSFGLA